jgi:hypothetical protein
MGLSKLLAVSRSVRSVTEQPARYKMTQQNLLPTFGGAKTAEAQVVGEVSPAPEAPPKPGSADAAATTEPAGPAGDGRCEAGPDKAASFLEATRKLRPFSGGTWFKNPFARTAAPKLEKRPVQTELSLDSVRPVRNDLSDSDVESGRAPDQAGGPMGIPSVPKAVPALASAATVGLWQRLKTRLFGATNAD